MTISCYIVVGHTLLVWLALANISYSKIYSLLPFKSLGLVLFFKM